MDVENYLKQISRLVKTMCIKSEITNEYINLDIKLKYGDNAFDKDDKYSWKYYMNISGDYHPTDSQMSVISLDSQESMFFTKENLYNNPDTKIAYSYGTEYYFELLKEYPTQESLILGILNPVDIDEAINAKDGTILYYDPSLVDIQEITLIQEVQDFIYYAMKHRDIRAYSITDELYPAAQLSTQIYLPLVTEIFNLRQSRCKTNEAHNFHAEQLLASHLGLADYFKFFTLEQKLFLYRNAEYLEKNIGKEELFELLIQKLLTKRGIPLAEYSIRQLNEFNEEKYPVLLTRRKPLNPMVNADITEFIPINKLFSKLEKVVYGNPDYLSIHQEAIIDRFKTSSSSVIQTKVLDSSMVDYSDAIPDPISTVLFRQLAHFSFNGLYDVSIKFKDTVTSEYRNLYAKDCFIYLVYLLIKQTGYEMEYIPNYVNLKYRRDEIPTLPELLSGIPDKYKDWMSPTANNIYINQPRYKECYTPAQFFRINHKIFTEAKRHWFLMESKEDAFVKAMTESITQWLYADEEINLSESENPVLFTDWLNVNSLPEYNYSPDQAEKLILSVYQAATGYTIDETKDLGSIQTAMIETLKKLCSYTVIFLTEINKVPIRGVYGNESRLTDISSSVNHKVHIEYILDEFDNSGKVFDSDKENLIQLIVDPALSMALHDVDEELVDSFILETTPLIVQTGCYEIPPEITLEYSGQDQNSKFPGEETFSLMTEEQKTIFFNFYR